MKPCLRSNSGDEGRSGDNVWGCPPQHRSEDFRKDGAADGGGIIGAWSFETSSSGFSQPQTRQALHHQQPPMSVEFREREYRAAPLVPQLHNQLRSYGTSGCPPQGLKESHIYSYANHGQPSLVNYHTTQLSTRPPASRKIVGSRLLTPRPNEIPTQLTTQSGLSRSPPHAWPTPPEFLTAPSTTSPTHPPPLSQQRRLSINSPLSSTHRGLPVQISPISEKRDSYASSAAIPATWPFGHSVQASFSSSESDSESDGGRTPISRRSGLVRQASLGRKTRPTLTEIKSVGRPSRTQNRNTAANQSPKTTAPPELKSSGPSPKLSTRRHFSLQKPSLASSLLSPPPVPADPEQGYGIDNWFSPNLRSQPQPVKKSNKPFPRALATGLGMDPSPSFDKSSSNTSSSSRRQSSTFSGGRDVGKLIPPSRHSAFVHDGESRASLTSLPDLIRRATRLAAVLETGRSGSHPQGSWLDMSSGTSSIRGRPGTDSLSDILASFPPPALAPRSSGTSPRRTSQWPLSNDVGAGMINSLWEPNEKRRICGLPVWVFIVLVLLALIIVTAAIVVPLQLVGGSQAQKEGNGGEPHASMFAQCSEKNPCLNGGQTVARPDFCGCVCTNGYTGGSCAEKPYDMNCVSYDFSDINPNNNTNDVKNATIGSSLPRLFAKAETFHIQLDPTLLLGVFSKANISCTLQNALVTFNGNADPDSELKSRPKRAVSLAVPQPDSTSAGSAGYEPSVSSALTATATQGANVLDPETVDFARVGVLYVAETLGIDTAETAQQSLSDSLRDCSQKDFTTVCGIVFLFNNKTIILRNGTVIGGVGDGNSTPSVPSPIGSPPPPPPENWI